MEDDEHENRVLKQRDAVKEPRLAQEHGENAVIHRVPRKSIQPADYEARRRIDWRERPATRREKIPDTAKQHAKAN